MVAASPAGIDPGRPTAEPLAVTPGHCFCGPPVCYSVAGLSRSSFGGPGPRSPGSTRLAPTHARPTLVGSAGARFRADHLRWARRRQTHLIGRRGHPCPRRYIRARPNPENDPERPKMAQRGRKWPIKGNDLGGHTAHRATHRRTATARRPCKGMLQKITDESNYRQSRPRGISPGRFVEFDNINCAAVTISVSSLCKFRY